MSENPATSDEIADAAVKFIDLRMQRVRLKSERGQALECTRPKTPEEIDEYGHWCPCYKVRPGLWCEPCKEARHIHLQYHSIAAKSGGALRRLQRLVKLAEKKE